MKHKILNAEAVYNDPSRVPVTIAAHCLFDLIKKVQQTGQRLILTRHGRAIAALCSLEDTVLIDNINTKSQSFNSNRR